MLSRSLTLNGRFFSSLILSVFRSSSSICVFIGLTISGSWTIGLGSLLGVVGRDVSGVTNIETSFEVAIEGTRVDSSDPVMGFVLGSELEVAPP